MPNNDVNPEDALKKQVRRLVDVHKQILLGLALMGLLKLQYDHEGHVDEDVHDLLVRTFFTVEQELSDVSRRLDVGDFPF